MAGLPGGHAERSSADRRAAKDVGRGVGQLVKQIGYGAIEREHERLAARRDVHVAVFLLERGHERWNSASGVEWLSIMEENLRPQGEAPTLAVRIALPRRRQQRLNFGFLVHPDQSLHHERRDRACGLDRVPRRRKLYGQGSSVARKRRPVEGRKQETTQRKPRPSVKPHSFLSSNFELPRSEERRVGKQ